jgi:hypothetical protein
MAAENRKKFVNHESIKDEAFLFDKSRLIQEPSVVIGSRKKQQPRRTDVGDWSAKAQSLWNWPVTELCLVIIV